MKPHSMKDAFAGLYQLSEAEMLKLKQGDTAQASVVTNSPKAAPQRLLSLVKANRASK